MEKCLHEILELNEMASFKSLCLTKSKTMKALVSDEKLKTIMQLDIDLSTQQLQDYEKFLSNAPLQ